MGVRQKDETGWRVNGKRSWLRCFGTKTDAYYVIDRSRGGNVVNDVLGEFFEGVSVRDFYIAYGACDMRETQYCLAHVRRDAKYIAEKYASVMTNEVREFCDGLTRLLRRAISFAAIPKIGPPMRERAYDSYVKRIYAITDGRFLNEDVERLAARLSQNAHSLFTFVKRPGVDPTNNFAEGLLRPAVIMRKRSFENRSENGAQTQAVLMSCFRSMKLRGLDLYEETKRLVHARILDDHATRGHDRASDRKTVTPLMLSVIPTKIRMDDQTKDYENKLNFQIDSWDLTVALEAGEEVVVIDARSPESYARGRIPGAVNIPHGTMSADTTAHLDKNALVVTYCDGIGCNGSTNGALHMLRLGFRGKELIGGLDWWRRDGHPIHGGETPTGANSCGCA